MQDAQVKIKRKSSAIKIHLVANGRICACCGEKTPEDLFLPGMCDAHTHGLRELGFTELQLVLDFSDEEIVSIINTAADMIISGEVVEEDGAVINNLFTDGAPVRLKAVKDDEGNDMFRLIISDGKNCMPEDSNEYPYCLQDCSPYRSDYFTEVQE